jgi:hypothetical protein
MGISRKHLLWELRQTCGLDQIVEMHIVSVVVEREGDMKTSQDVSDPGLYASMCCGYEKNFDEQDVFQRCPHCLSLCVWELTETIIDRPEREREIA